MEPSVGWRDVSCAAHCKGRTTRNGSHWPNGNAVVLGVRPYPTMTVPSAEMPFRVVSWTHLSAVCTPAVSKMALSSCIPLVEVQMKQSEDPRELEGSEVPTITEPPPLTAQAALSGPPRVPMSCMPVEAVQRNARQDRKSVV